MVSLLVTILIYALIFAVAWWVLSLIPLPAPFGMVAQVILGLIALLLIINLLLPFAGSSHGLVFR